jgi:hypothetical protein
MLRRYSHFFAYLLLVLMPLQALASANMLVCNSIMQVQATKMFTQSAMAKQSVQQASCHQHINNSVEQVKHQDNHQSSCNALCAATCANLSALSALTNNIKFNFQPENMQLFDFNNQNYASITLPNLQRPPITFI